MAIMIVSSSMRTLIVPGIYHGNNKKALFMPIVDYVAWFFHPAATVPLQPLANNRKPSYCKKLNQSSIFDCHPALHLCTLTLRQLT